MLSGEGSNSFATDKPMDVRFGIKLEYRNVHMYKGIKGRKAREKSSSDKNRHHPQPTHESESRIQTGATLLEGKCFY